MLTVCGLCQKAVATAMSLLLRKSFSQTTCHLKSLENGLGIFLLCSISTTLNWIHRAELLHINQPRSQGICGHVLDVFVNLFGIDCIYVYIDWLIDDIMIDVSTLFENVLPQRQAVGTSVCLVRPKVYPTDTVRPIIFVYFDQVRISPYFHDPTRLQSSLNIQIFWMIKYDAIQSWKWNFKIFSFKKACRLMVPPKVS